MNFRPKLVAFDLDGTLAESKQRISLDTASLLSQLLAHMPVAILSGAAFSQFELQFLPSFSSNVHFERLYLFPDNASICYSFESGQWVSKYNHSFNNSEKARIMQALNEALAEVGMSEPPKPVWGERIEDREGQITFSALGQQAPIDIKKAWDPTREKRKPLHVALLRRLPDFSVSMNAATSIDITHKGINKAYGIRKLIELTGISVSEMLYVGDALEEGGNDAVVLETGIKTHEVLGPEETLALIKHIIAM